jgi:hypothetical protein
MTYIPYLSTIVAFAFALAVFNRHRQRGGSHLLLWAIGLVFYGLGTLTESILSFAPSIFLLRIWYLTGAMLTAAWLGMGTVHLLVRKGNIAQILTGILAAISILAFILVFLVPTTSVTYDIARPASEQYREIFTSKGFLSYLLAPTIILNLYGTITLVGGAIYSAFLFWRKRILVNRMFGNILIAAGALSPAMGGTFLRAGLTDMLYLSEFVGAVLMFIGFMMATGTQSEMAPAT